MGKSVNSDRRTNIDDCLELRGISSGSPLNREDYQKIVDYTRSAINYRRSVSVLIKDIPMGRGYFFKKVIMLPKWLEKHNKLFGVYYVIHELTHCLVGVKHNQNFARMEDYLLGLWDIRIVRNKAYPKKIIHRGVEINIIPFTSDQYAKFACNAGMGEGK